MTMGFISVVQMPSKLRFLRYSSILATALLLFFSIAGCVRTDPHLNRCPRHAH